MKLYFNFNNTLSNKYIYYLILVLFAACVVELNFVLKFIRTRKF
jgi:hypothetical protein